MKLRIKKNFKFISIVCIAMCILPLSMFGDGGMPRRKCTKFVHYDIQPTNVSRIQLVLKELKINGKTKNIESIETIIPIQNNGYRMKRSCMDTLTIQDMNITHDNTQITSFGIIYNNAYMFTPFVKK